MALTEHSVSDGALTVFLKGHVDTTNAEALEKEILDAVTASGAGKLILDADKLEYISSAGLRVILRMR
ncbi:MAG: STAS domain-containing protein, partial [Oscillospiraceae bacterium]|nr:STAS domain-containing protein [Oscillospiraceae bacterium]